MCNSETDPDENADSNTEAHFSARDGEFLLALLTLRGFIVFQPSVTLNKDTTSREENMKTKICPKFPEALKGLTLNRNGTERSLCYILGI